MAFSSHVHNSEFWKPDNKWGFFQLILNYFIYNCTVRVKESIELLIWAIKNRGAQNISSNVSLKDPP